MPRSLDKWPQRIAAACGVYAVVGSLVTLAGWFLDIPRLADWPNGGIWMFPNSAFCALLLGIALLLTTAGATTNPLWIRVLALPAVAIGTLTLVEHLTNANLGIDGMLIQRPWGQSPAAAEHLRMGPPASLSIVMLGCGLLLAQRGESARRATAVLGITTMIVAALSLTGWFYGAAQMYTMPRLTGIAMQTATILFALSIGVLATVPEREPFAVAVNRGAAGMLTRRALPLIILVSLSLGWIRVWLQTEGYVDTAFGTALRTLVEIVLLAGLLWRAAVMIRDHEQALRKSESELRRQAGQLAAFLETAAIGLHRTDESGKIDWANDAELEALGYSREEFVGHNIAEFYCEPERAAELLDRLRKDEKIRDFPAQLRCKDGSVKLFLVDSSVLRENGRFIHTQCFTRDITERVRGEETRLLLANIVQATDDVIVSKTLEGIVTSWNPGAERLFGYSEAEMLGKPIEVIIPPDRRGEEQQILSKLRRGEGIDHYETVRITRSGRLVDVSLTVSPIRDASGRVVGASKIARDITERKRAEQEREEASRRKDEFIAILAHELRNPLAPVRNLAHYLKSLDYPDVQRPVEMIERQVSQMSRLIDDLLDVSRISRGMLELRRERVPLVEIVEAAVDSCRTEVQAKRHLLNTSLPPQPVELDADKERLVQVLSNLLLNAAKYTPTGGQIDLVVNVDGPLLEISVKDDGVGIPADKLEEIFELFTRVDHSLDRQGGLGIGLTLAKQIVELHGGYIEARSHGIGAGSEFYVKLPVVVSASALDPLDGGQPAQPVIPRRVLVADDSRDAAESLAMLLKLAGHDVHTAFDGEAAIQSAESVQPDAALLDIGMPRANGYQVARHIRGEPWGKHMLLVALTGWGQESDKRRAAEAGFDVHLVKPVSPEAIEELLATLPVAASDSERRARMA